MAGIKYCFSILTGVESYYAPPPKFVVQTNAEVGLALSLVKGIQDHFSSLPPPSILKA